MDILAVHVKRNCEHVERALIHIPPISMPLKHYVDQQRTIRCSACRDKFPYGNPRVEPPTPATADSLKKLAAKFKG
jgi:hypothetical protein